MRPSFLCLLAPAVVSATQYNFAKEYSGSSFFDGWNFYGNYDNLTNGDAIFVNASAAASDKLAYVDPSTNHAIIKVDNTTTVPYNYKRNTVRINTLDTFSVGSVWVSDMVHVPYGCSVWPVSTFHELSIVQNLISINRRHGGVKRRIGRWEGRWTLLKE